MAELEDEAGTVALGDMVGHHPSKLLQCFEAVDASSDVLAGLSDLPYQTQPEVLLRRGHPSISARY